MWGPSRKKKRTQQDQMAWERHRLLMTIATTFSVVAFVFVLIVMGYYVESLLSGEQTPTLAHMSDLMAGFFKVIATALGG